MAQFFFLAGIIDFPLNCTRQRKWLRVFFISCRQTCRGNRRDCFISSWWFCKANEIIFFNVNDSSLRKFGVKSFWTPLEITFKPPENFNPPFLRFFFICEIKKIKFQTLVFKHLKTSCLPSSSQTSFMNYLLFYHVLAIKTRFRLCF